MRRNLATAALLLFLTASVAQMPRTEAFGPPTTVAVALLRIVNQVALVEDEELVIEVCNEDGVILEAPWSVDDSTAMGLGTTRTGIFTMEANPGTPGALTSFFTNTWTSTPHSSTANAGNTPKIAVPASGQPDALLLRVTVAFFEGVASGAPDSERAVELIVVMDCEISLLSCIEGILESQPTHDSLAIVIANCLSLEYSSNPAMVELTPHVGFNQGCQGEWGFGDTPGSMSLDPIPQVYADQGGMLLAAAGWILGRAFQPPADADDWIGGLALVGPVWYTVTCVAGGTPNLQAEGWDGPLLVRNVTIHHPVATETEDARGKMSCEYIPATLPGGIGDDRCTTTLYFGPYLEVTYTAVEDRWLAYETPSGWYVYRPQEHEARPCMDEEWYATNTGVPGPLHGTVGNAYDYILGNADRCSDYETITWLPGEYVECPDPDVSGCGL